MHITARSPVPGDIDTSRPNVARIYDYLLGGKDNFAVDREAARRLIEATPDIAGIVRDNRSFIGRVVWYLAADAGIRQFIDLGGGLPTQTNVHDMARKTATTWRREAAWPSAMVPPAPRKMTPTTSPGR